jgi:hypothetical protein
MFVVMVLACIKILGLGAEAKGLGGVPVVRSASACRLSRGVFRGLF